MPASCRTCRLPAPLLADVERKHRRGVPYRTIAAELRAAGHPVLKDALYRHCRDHAAPADLHDVDHTAPEHAAGLTVAVVVADHLLRWPHLAAAVAADLRAEGLDAAADLVFATTPETMREALIKSAGTPASEVAQARLLVRAMRAVLGGGYPEATRALAGRVRALGGDNLADALDDLAATVEEAARTPAASQPEKGPA